MSQQQYTSTLWEQRPQAEWEVDSSCDENFPRNITFIDNLKLDPKLQPTTYHLAGSHTSSKILFTDVSVLDSTGQKPYGGDLLIKGERISQVGTVDKKEHLEDIPTVRVFRGRGRTLMSGLGDAHTHYTWNGGDLTRLSELDIEGHVLLTVKSAQCLIDSRAIVQNSLDVVVRDAINAGDIPGPRQLDNTREIGKPDGELVADITKFADGPERMSTLQFFTNPGLLKIMFKELLD